MLTQSCVEDNGNLTLVANPNTLRRDILQLDLDRAHRRTQLTASMKKQVRFAAALLLCSCPGLACGRPQQPLHCGATTACICMPSMPSLRIVIYVYVYT